MNCCNPTPTNEQVSTPPETENQKRPSSIPPAAIFILGIMIGALGIYGYYNLAGLQKNYSSIDAAVENENLPSFSEDVILPVRWGDLGIQMVQGGALDAPALEKIYDSRGGADGEAKKMLYSDNNGNIVINQKNAGFLLNLLWGLGLGNKNPILENGPMQDKKYGGAANFASTGGWTLARGKTMDHYSAHSFIMLTPDQQTLVEKVSQGVFRPCCSNSTFFPDCNHGMAMLGLLELLASQGASEDQMYKTALVVNSYWFPDTYKTIAKFMLKKGIAWEDVNPKEILGANFSSGPGYSQILKQVEPVKGSSGGSCGV